MNNAKQPSQALIWVGVLGIVLLLVASLTYALSDSESRYSPEQIRRAAEELVPK